MGSAEQRAALSVWPRIYAAGRGDVQLRGVAERARSDAQAAWQRWHRPACAQAFSPTARHWYTALERARVETLAANGLPGMRENLARLDLLAPAEALAARLYRGARQVLAGAAVPPELWPPPETETWRARLADWHGRRAAQRRRIEALAHALLPAARACLDDAQRFADLLRPLIEAYDRIFPGQAAHLPLPVLPLEGDGGPGVALASSPGAAATDTDAGYRVYARDWDRLLTRRELAKLPPASQPLLPAPLRAHAARLAERLRRRLLAQCPGGWRFEQEEGALDARRLASLVASGNRAVFRQESRRAQPHACVTLLLDLSGSMRGRPWQLAALAVDLAVQALEAANIRCEVLGYASGFGVDNPLHTAWCAAGEPARPGRLNALRHVQFKSAEQPWRLCRGLLAREGVIGGENFDGEALAWAAGRLLRQPQARRILLVLSDGQPHDEATVRANGRGYLEDHLHRCIAALAAAPLQLAALGAGQGVGRFYRHSRTLAAPEDIFQALFECLAEQLDASGVRKGGTRG